MNYWISAPESMAKELRDMGIGLGVRKGDSWEGCSIPDDAMKRLDALWGAIFWGQDIPRRPILDQLLARVRDVVGAGGAVKKHAPPIVQEPPAVVTKRKPARRIR